jgi:putative nucleotidyltransferase with HDIG domain
MTRRLAVSIAALACLCGALLMGAVLTWRVSPRISIDGSDAGILPGLVFWTLLALAGSSLAVRMPGGTLVDVSYAPIVAAMSLGGPTAAGVLAAIGTTQARELRREVPWYGVITNHALIAVPAVLSAWLLQFVGGRDDIRVDFIATLGAGALCFALNFSLAGLFLWLRSGSNLHGGIKADVGAWAAMLALAPVAWLMAQMYVSAGWWAVLLFAVPLYTTRVAYTRFVELREMFTETVRSLAEAVDKRDTFTAGHSHRVQEIAMDIGREMRLNDSEMEALEWGGLLHDIGKIGVPDSVLLKQERLTREERATMNAHPVIGAEIIAPVKRLEPELPIIRHHHEWFNGSGYPDRLMGDEIPRLARILHVADAFEAMTAARPYRMTPLSPEQALAEMRKFGGIQFDPAVVEAFTRTKWGRDLADPGRPQARRVPLIGQAAGSIGTAAGSASAKPA